MKVYRNLADIKRKESLGRRLTLGGLLILFVGMMSSFVPNWYPPGEAAPNQIAAFLQSYWIFVSFGALMLGFLLASFGSYFINRFAPRRWPGSKTIGRPDEVVERSLKGFDDKYSLFLWSLPTGNKSFFRPGLNSYVLSGPCGLIAFTLRGDKGSIQVNGERWREPFSLTRLFTVFAREGVGNPSQELAEQVDALKALTAAAPADQTEGEDLSQIPAIGAVLFINPEVQLQLENPSVEVLRADQIKAYVRNRTKEVRLRAGQVRALNNYLEGQASFEPVE